MLRHRWLLGLLAPLVLLACSSDPDDGGEPGAGAAGSPAGGASGAGQGGAAGAGKSGAAGSPGGGQAGAAGSTGGASGQASSGSSGQSGAGGTAGTAGTTAGSSGAAGATAGAGGAAGASAGAAGQSGGSGQAGAGRDLSTDRQKFFGQSRCQGAGLWVCEDFESGGWDKSVWTTEGDVPVVATGQHARGDHALRIKRDKAQGLSRLAHTKSFPAPSDRYYGRAFFRWERLPQTASYTHWTVVAATGSGVKGEIRVGGQLSKGQNLWGVGTDGDTGDWTNSDKDPGGKPRAVPEHEWMCIEWLHDGDKDETHFWWDATEHTSLATTPTTKHGGDKQGVPYVMPEFQKVWVGWHNYQDIPEGIELWVDEIALDGERIGCVL